MRNFSSLEFKESHIRCLTSNVRQAKLAIKLFRREIERYIADHPDFKTSLESIPVDSEAPEIIQAMQRASEITGIGPMASVAGAISQFTAEYCQEGEAIIENGGDIFLRLTEEATIGLFAGKSPLSGKLALRFTPSDTPLAICTSSKDGNSISLGRADAVTVLSSNAALADSAATLGGNWVQSTDDLEGVANKVASLKGINGCIIILGDRIALAGKTPEIVKIQGSYTEKITHSKEWVIES